MTSITHKPQTAYKPANRHILTILFVIFFILFSFIATYLALQGSSILSTQVGLTLS